MILPPRQISQFYVYVQISTRVVFVNGKHLWAQMCPKKFTTTQYWPSLKSNLKMANTFFKFQRRALPNGHLCFTDTISYVHTACQTIPIRYTPRTRCGKIICHSNACICGWNPMTLPDITPLGTIYFFGFYETKVDFFWLFSLLLILLFTSSNFETFLYWRTRTII